MNLKLKHIILFVLPLLALTSSCNMQRYASGKENIVVDQSGGGDFTSIQQAINSLPDTAAKTRVIIIRPGIYHEKIFLTKHNLVLKGANREQTIITQDIARDAWRCEHPDDWGVATFNMAANDVTLENLTISNEYGFHQKNAVTIPCQADSVNGTKTIHPDGHQMALRTKDGTTTRFRAINCHFKAWGGDTVSPWNTKDGMFYFKDCIMEGGVDFYCPRGYAYAENCRFFAHTGTASIWHDGTGNPDYKTVLRNCSFDGFDGFKLGRYHREAQFFLLDCRFSKNMADAAIYFVPGNLLQWGRRVYYYNCSRDGGNYSWFENNLNEAPGQPQPQQITVSWVFGGKWNPEADKI